MVYKFKITSLEKEDFSRVVKIKEDQTFLELHETIQHSVDYDDSQLASFYTLDAMGMRNKEVSLFEMEDEENGVETYVMDVTMIREILDKEKDKLLYVFDFFGDRAFDISFIGTEKEEENLIYPVCAEKEGEAPVQLSLDADLFTDDEKSEKKSSPEDYLSDPYLMEMDEDEGPKFESLDDYQDIL
jgi:hypothetical protein